MSDSMEPPAKRARLDLDARSSAVSTLDVPNSPIDDMDDDFYDTTPAKPASRPIDAEDGPEATTTTSANFSALPIPGLGLLAQDASVKQNPVQNSSPAPLKDDEFDEGEVSDSEAFYSDVKAVSPSTAGQQQTIGATQAGKLLQHA